MKKLLTIFLLLISFITFNKELSPEVLNRLSPNSLNRYYDNKYSQSSEDAVAEEIFKRLNIHKGFCVEFGAGNGITLSNTRKFLEKGWFGIMIEPDSASFNLLQQTYSDSSNVLCLQEFVAFKEGQGKTFDEIADLYFPENDIDFLSIDIDGGDYLVFENLHRQPKVICIEIGLHWHPLLNIRIPDEYAVHDRQQPILVMCDIAKAKGYKPICFEGGNLFLIRADLYSFFTDLPEDPLILWRDGWRSSPLSHDYIINLHQRDSIIIRFEGQLNNEYPITKDF
jgi:hypothetical protein